MKYVYRFQTLDDRKKAVKVLNETYSGDVVGYSDIVFDIAENEIVAKLSERAMRKSLPDFQFELTRKRKLKLVEKIGGLIGWLVDVWGGRT